MDKGITKVIRNYIRYLKKSNLEFNKVYLFGSYAKNKQTANSDIDLAFIFDKHKQIDFFDLQVQMLTLASEIDTRIEPHPMSSDDFTIENPLAFEIISTGKEILMTLLRLPCKISKHCFFTHSKRNGDFSP